MFNVHRPSAKAKVTPNKPQSSIFTVGQLKTLKVKWAIGHSMLIEIKMQCNWIDLLFQEERFQGHIALHQATQKVEPFQIVP